MQVSLLEWPLFTPDQVPGFLLAFWDGWAVRERNVVFVRVSVETDERSWR